MISHSKFRSKLKLLSTYFLVSHGSRDQRAQLELQTLAELLSRQPSLTKPTNNDVLKYPIIGTGILELGLKSLHQQIEDFAQHTREIHITQIQVVPLFLLPGVHVKEDIPAEIAIASRNLLNAQIEINLCSHIGSHPDITYLLATKMTPVIADVWILLSHGSRRSGGNEPVEKIAQFLQQHCHVFVHTAYWSVPPEIESVVEILIRQGYQQIGILPYFLFSAGLTDAIAQTVKQLAEIYPTIKFHLTEPLGATDELAKLILDLIQ